MIIMRQMAVTFMREAQNSNSPKTLTRNRLTKVITAQHTNALIHEGTAGHQKEM